MKALTLLPQTLFLLILSFLSVSSNLNDEKESIAILVSKPTIDVVEEVVSEPTVYVVEEIVPEFDNSTELMYKNEIIASEEEMEIEEWMTNPSSWNIN